MAETTPSIIKCIRCTFRGPQTAFPRSSALKYLKTCITCLAKGATKRAQEARDTEEDENKENHSPSQGQISKGKSRAINQPPTLSSVIPSSSVKQIETEHVIWWQQKLE